MDGTGIHESINWWVHKWKKTLARAIPSSLMGRCCDGSHKQECRKTGIFLPSEATSSKCFPKHIRILLQALLKTILVPSTQPEASQLPPWAPLLPLPYQCYAWPSCLINIQGFVFCVAEMMHLPWHGPQGRCTCPSWSQMATSLLFTFPSCSPRYCKNHPKNPQILCQEL